MDSGIFSSNKFSILSGWNSLSFWDWFILSQVFGEPVCMPWCFILHTCGHGCNWNAWIQWFGWISIGLYQYNDNHTLIYIQNVYIQPSREQYGACKYPWTGIEHVEVQHLAQGISIVPLKCPSTTPTNSPLCNIFGPQIQPETFMLSADNRTVEGTL